MNGDRYLPGYDSDHSKSQPCIASDDTQTSSLSHTCHFRRSIRSDSYQSTRTWNLQVFVMNPEDAVLKSEMLHRVRKNERSLADHPEVREISGNWQVFLV